MADATPGQPPPPPPLLRRSSTARLQSADHDDDSWFGRHVDRMRHWWRRRRRLPQLDKDALATITIPIRSDLPRAQLPNNVICTSKYSWWNFFVLATLLQFRRFSNAFFLFVCVVNAVGYFLPHLYTVTYVPWGTLSILTFVVLVALVFEGADDLERHRADRITNGKPTRTVRAGDGDLEPCEWGHLLAGQVVRVLKGEMVPADILIVDTSTDNGICYIETSGIDGETNLKIRTRPKELHDSNISSATLEGSIECEEPNSFLQFSGAIHLADGTDVGVGFNSVILRGSRLCNTAWIDGVVLYAGQDTKLILSSSETPSKFSRIDTAINRMMGYILLVYIAIVVVADLILIFDVPNTNTLWYFRGLNVINDFMFPGWLAYLLTFSGTFASIVPINMYVCLEIVNYVQARYINWDLNMYDQRTDTRAHCRTGSLVTEIGQVTHVFSDKTGTLTNNEMRLVSLAVGGRLAGWVPPDVDDATEPAHDPTSAPPSPQQAKHGPAGSQAAPNSPHSDQTRAVAATTPPYIPATELFADLIANTREADEALLLALAVCHTVVIDHAPNGAVQYNAEGPDEEALVSAAASLGCRLVSTEADVYRVDLSRAGETREFQLLGVNAFSSARKRMSVVVRDCATDEVVLFIKGADNVMFDLCPPAPDLAPQLDRDLSRFSMAGLRTLVVGRRVLDDQTLQTWRAQHARAKTLLGHERESALEDAATLVERDFEVLGITGIEDALQEGVPDTVQAIRDAGIDLWVLTGDKIQTAINIALSARIMDATMTRILLDGEDRHELMAQIASALNAVQGVISTVAETRADNVLQPIRSVTSNRSSDRRYNQLGQHADEQTLLLEEAHAPSPSAHQVGQAETLVAETLALIVSGRALKMLLATESGTAVSESRLFELASLCSVVLACRVSPKQKALLVGMVANAKTVRRNYEPVTLAIGDGANDVAMIQQARIGVGISGHEGLQAVNSSDFSIARFRFLRELLLVHGRWNYQRSANMVKYITYSWVVQLSLVFFYVFFSMVSGQSVYVNSYYLTLYAWVTNSVIAAIAWFQKDIGRRYVITHPSVYQVGRLNRYMNGKAIAKMCLRAFVHATVLIVIVFFTFPLTGDLATLGIMAYTSVFMIMFVRQVLMTMDVNLFIVFCFTACALLFLFGVYVADVFLSSEGVALLFQFSTTAGACGAGNLAWSRGFLAGGAILMLEYSLFGIPKLIAPSPLRLEREVFRCNGGDLTLANPPRPPMPSARLNQREPPGMSHNAVARLVRQASTRTPGMDPLSSRAALGPPPGGYFAQTSPSSAAAVK